MPSIVKYRIAHKPSKTQIEPDLYEPNPRGVILILPAHDTMPLIINIMSNECLTPFINKDSKLIQASPMNDDAQSSLAHHK